jgi:subtilisin-like proprotein convertase family protein
LSRRNLYILAVLMAFALVVSGLAFGGQPATQAQAPTAFSGPRGPLPDALKEMSQYMKTNHGKLDNLLTATYERWLAGEDVAAAARTAAAAKASGPFSPLYGPDVRMSNTSFAGSQNEFQIDINPTDSHFAIGTSNDGRTAGVGIYRTSDSGATWTAIDAPIGVSACCDPAVVYAFDGTVYVGILSTSAGEYVIKSTDNGATWSPRVAVVEPDRNNLTVDNGATSPRRGTVYTTYSDLASGGSNRIKGYRSTDNGATWGTSFFVGDVAPAQGYEQSSQPRVASDGTLYVGYQQYTNSGVGCSAGVQNVLARSTDGGASFTYTVLPIVQGGACSGAQAGRGIFCINASSSFRSRSFPVIGVNPTNPQHVYMMYSGGDLETAYTCAGSTGFHSDTLFRKSTDGGATFTAPQKINTDPSGKDQYFPWMEVAPNGQIWVGWNDRREDTNNFMSRWYQASSNDEGNNWAESPVADVQTQPSTFIGDYHGLAAKNDLVLGMWYDSRSNASGDPYTDPHVPVQGTPTPTTTGSPATATPTRSVTNTPIATLTPTRTPTACGVLTFVSTDVPKTICDLCTITSTLQTSGVGTISHISLRNLNITHTFIGDLIVTLTSPGSTTVTVVSRQCGSSANIPGVNFDDAGSGPMACPPAAGATYTPFSPLSAFNGQNGNGTWILTVSDNAQIDSGTLNAWGLAFSTSTGCGTATNTPIVTPTPNVTLTPTRTATTANTNTPTATNPSIATNTPTPGVPPTRTHTATPTPCAITFTDVHTTDFFYQGVVWLYCRGAISGYGDNTFRPFNNTTRGQMVKIVTLAYGIATYIPPTPTFNDVPVTDPFYQYIETAAHNSIVSGYNCGGVGEPCPGVYFRPVALVTRGQLSKIVVVAAGWALLDPVAATFIDVIRGTTAEDLGSHALGSTSGLATTPREGR